MECLNTLEISDIVIGVWKARKKGFVDGPTVNGIIFCRRTIYWIEFSNRYSSSLPPTVEPVWRSDILFIELERIIELNSLNLLGSVASNIIVLFRSFE